jgi:hypothetical protein
MKQIPAVLLKVKGAWIINNVDLASAGNPARPCEGAMTTPDGAIR